MTKCLFVFFQLTLFVCSPVFSETRRVEYFDTLGNKWLRWIIVEEQDHKKILLVVEAPAKEFGQRIVTQEIVTRTKFSKIQIKELQTKINYYTQLVDVKNRSTDYYRLREPGPISKTANPLWTPIKNGWSLDDENKFSEWYKSNGSTTATRGAGLDFDCADYGLLNRWIYAHDNKLPVANSLSGSGKLFGHFSESKKWSHLPTNQDWKKDERFKAAMKYLFDSTYTHSIYSDLYPVEISKEFITPGTIILTLRSGGSGHTQVVFNVGYQDYCQSECITVLYGNEPSRDYSYLTQATIEQHIEKRGGFLKWRWPVFKKGRWQLTSKTEMPGYSLDQYKHAELSYDEFYAFILESVGLKIPPYQKAYSMANSLYNDLIYRATNTALGALYCRYQYCDPSGKLYDDYSTPSKDKRFREKRDQFLRQVAKLTFNEEHQLKNEFNRQFLFPGNTLPHASDYIFNINGISDRMSSDPSVDFSQRWGLENMSNLDSTLIQSSLFALIWYYRTELVYEAISLCVDSSTAESDCDVNSVEIKSLFTNYIDSVLRTVHGNIQTQFFQLDHASKNIALLEAAQSYFTQGCPQRTDGYCRAEDYLFMGKELVNKMTSDPRDPFTKRMGLE